MKACKKTTLRHLNGYQGFSSSSWVMSCWKRVFRLVPRIFARFWLIFHIWNSIDQTSSTYRFAYELLSLTNSYKKLIPAGKKLIENILSEHIAISWLVCALHCQRYVNEFCVGFNYKPTMNDNEVNCQLTVAQQQRDGVIEAKTKNDWVFYQRQYIKVKFNSSFRQDEVISSSKTGWSLIKS